MVLLAYRVLRVPEDIFVYLVMNVDPSQGWVTGYIKK